MYLDCLLLGGLPEQPLMHAARIARLMHRVPEQQRELHESLKQEVSNLKKEDVHNSFGFLCLLFDYFDNYSLFSMSPFSFIGQTFVPNNAFT